MGFEMTSPDTFLSVVSMNFYPFSAPKTLKHRHRADLGCHAAVKGAFVEELALLDKLP
jgi:hypothetical protein